jgi:hypothetical protein
MPNMEGRQTHATPTCTSQNRAPLYTLCSSISEPGHRRCASSDVVLTICTLMVLGPSFSGSLLSMVVCSKDQDETNVASDKGTLIVPGNSLLSVISLLSDLWLAHQLQRAEKPRSCWLDIFLLGFLVTFHVRLLK